MKDNDKRQATTSTTAARIDTLNKYQRAAFARRLFGHLGVKPSMLSRIVEVR